MRFGIALLIALVVPAAAFQDKALHSVGEAGVTAPRLISKTNPQYTKEARDARIEGRVGVRCVVETDGHPGELSVVQPLDPGLDARALEAVKKWKFEPAKKDGKPVRVAAVVEVNFSLK